MSNARVPSQKECILPAMHAIRALGGAASIGDINHWIIEHFQLSDEQLAQRRRSGQRVISHNIAFALTRLKYVELVGNETRGRWEFTELGHATTTIDPDEIVRESNRIIKQRREAKQRERQVLPIEPKAEGQQYPSVEPWQVITEPDDAMSRIGHDEIQWLLLSLANEMKLDLWVASNDRSKSFQGNVFSELPRLRRNLPVQFDQKTQRIIELIDVLWLDGNSIIAAFEIEHTTSIYSGLLRMSDLIALQPNLNTDLYIVAPDERRDKVKTEINRPTFARLRLPRRCRYIAYSGLIEKIDQATHGGFLRHLSPSILDELAEDM